MPRHLTARIAWHDNGWNGNVCCHPSSNFYCVGARSLLSDRLRRDKDEVKEDSIQAQPADALFPEYIPPCYWGINAYGSTDRRIRHRHPFADLKETHTVDEELPPYSIFTWPFRVSYTFDEETEKRYGRYHPKFEDRINEFFAAHQEGRSIVFLYMNYDNPVSGDVQRYAVVGCGLLKEKGKTTRFNFDKKTLDSYKSAKGMQNFPVTNWSRRLTLDPDTIVRLPYQEYIQHVRRTPGEEAKLDEISVLVDDDALLPSFKYVCDSMDDDQCLVILHKLRRAFDRVAAHGIASGSTHESVERLDRLIEHVWKQRGTYPGMASAVAYLARLGSQDEEANEVWAQRLIETIREALPEGGDLASAVEELLTEETPLSGSLQQFKSLLRHARRAVQDDQAVLGKVLRLSTFCLSAFQMERILGAETYKSEDAPFGLRRISTNQLMENPYLLAESYAPLTEASDQKWREMERPLRRDGPIGVFHIDAGLFPDEKFVNSSDLHSLSAIGPQRVRALALRYLAERATENSDCFAPVGEVYAAVCQAPLFYRRELVFREDALTSTQFIRHFSDRIEYVENESGGYFYLREIREAEKLVERIVRRLTDRADHPADLNWVDAWIEEVVGALQPQVRGFDAAAFRDERRAAIEALLCRSFVAVSGRPGSGKTQVIGQIVRRLLDAKESVTVLAPTGKAVLRLDTDAKVSAKTIDRFLYDAWLGEAGIAGVETIPDRAVEKLGDIRNLIIDESSMLDLPKLATLFRILEKQGLDKTRRVILVGDTNQLPPIGLGRPFEDLLSWLDQDKDRKRRHHVHLEVNCRQREDATVLDAAELFVARNRYYDELLDRLRQGGQISDQLRVVLWRDSKELCEAVDRELGRLIERETKSGWDRRHEGLNLLLGLARDGTVPGKPSVNMTLERFQVLTPYYRRYAHAAQELNERIRELYKSAWWPAKAGFSNGDKIIRLSNKYDGKPRELVLSNGSIGVVNFRGSPPQARACFSSTDKAFSIGGSEAETAEYDLAYAITVHKAQGSDFEHVFVVLPSHYPLLTRELVYTALTRSKRSVTLFLESSDKSPLDIALRRSAVLSRNSSILTSPLDKRRLLQPEEGQFVDSKVEYIIYTTLMRARNEGRLTFKHHEQTVLTWSGGQQVVHPDFTIETGSGRWYLEHLGMLDAKRYSEKWQLKRASYRAAGLEDKVVTTDDLNGLTSERLDRVIADLCAGTPAATPASRFSLHHYPLWN